MGNARDRQLRTDQYRLLQAVYDHFRDAGTWPTFDEIDRQLDRGRRPLDAGKLARTIPTEILPGFQRPPHIPKEVRLALEGVALCNGSEDDVERFLSALRCMAQRWRNYTPEPGGAATSPVVNNKQLARSLRIPKREAAALSRLFELLRGEQWGWDSAQGPDGDGLWSFHLSRDVRRFRHVRSLDDYRAAQSQWRLETKMRMVDDRSVPGDPDAATPASAPVEGSLQQGPSYVGAAVIREIESAKQRSKWDCRKLLELIRELNVNVASGNGYAANALLRAILDHVPPVFGCKNFAGVVSNVSWGRTDENYVRQLIAFRVPADDALHRQITKTPTSPLTVDDLPPRRAINRLLDECANRL